MTTSYHVSVIKGGKTIKYRTPLFESVLNFAKGEDNAWTDVKRFVLCHADGDLRIAATETFKNDELIVATIREAKS